MPPQRGSAVVEETGPVCTLLSLFTRSQRALAMGPHLLASDRDWHKSHFGSNSKLVFSQKEQNKSETHTAIIPQGWEWRVIYLKEDVVFLPES